MSQFFFFFLRLTQINQLQKDHPPYLVSEHSKHVSYSTASVSRECKSILVELYDEIIHESVVSEGLTAEKSLFLK